MLATYSRAYYLLENLAGRALPFVHTTLQICEMAHQRPSIHMLFYARIPHLTP